MPKTKCLNHNRVEQYRIKGGIYDTPDGRYKTSDTIVEKCFTCNKVGHRNAKRGE